MSHKRSIFVFSLLLSCFALLLGTVLLSRGIKASAEERPTYKVAQMSDVHVYAKECCNENSPDYLQAEDYFNLLYDSEDTFLAGLEILREQDPDYLIVSGDLSADGGRTSHEIVAAHLRDFQREMRETKPDFQVFVIPGNHDILNASARRFTPTAEELADKSEGERRDLIDNFTVAQARPITLIDFYEIYRDLGYGGETKGDVRYFHDSDYFYGVGDSDYRIALKTEDPDAAELTAAEEDRTVYDRASRVGGLSYIANMADGFTLVALDSTRYAYSETPRFSAFESKENPCGHWTSMTGGDVNHAQLLWIADELSDLRAKNELVVATAHHSIVPHFDMEDDIVTDFVVYDYRTVSYSLADLGIHYVLTGHVHANDITSYVSQKGNVLYDIETPSTCTYGAGVRLLEWEKSAEGEKVYNSLFPITSLESSGITDLVGYLDDKTSQVLSDVADGAFDASFLSRIDKAIDSLAGKQLIGQEVGALTISFLKDVWAQFLALDLAKPKINGERYVFASATSPDYHLPDLAHDLIEYLFSLDASCGRVPGGYSMSRLANEVYRINLVGSEGYVLPSELQAVSEALTSGELTDKILRTLVDFLIPQLEVIFDAKIGLTESVPLGKGFDLSSYGEKFASSRKEFGAFLYSLFADNEADSLRSFAIRLKPLLSNPLFTSILGSFGKSDVLGKVTGYLAMITQKTSLRDFLQEQFLEKYMTPALSVNLGCYTNKLLLSFATDPTPDGATTERRGENLYYEYPVRKLLTLPLADGSLAWEGALTLGAPLSSEQNPPTVQDGRIPDMISMTYGEDPYTTLNVKWFTRIQADLEGVSPDASYFVYTIEDGSEQIAKATDEYKNLTVPLIDLGVLYLTSSKVRYTMHTVTLTFPEEFAGERVTFRVGSDLYGYSDTYSFRLKSRDGAVTILAIADIQGSVEENYLQSAANAALARSVVSDADLLISAGDNVDKSDNTYQWEWLFRHDQALFRDLPFLSAAGNHENGGNALNDFTAIPSAATLTYKSEECNGYYCSYEIENAHVCVLNTNDTDAKGALSAKQLRWLKNDLQAADGKWKIVVMHKGPYTAGSHAFDADVIALRSQLTPLFAEYGVSVVLQGHDHCYSLSEYLDKEGKVVTPDRDGAGNDISPDGVLYLNLGTLGDKFYNYIYHEDVPLVDRSRNDYLRATPIGRYFAGEALELIGAPAFGSLTVTENKITLVTYAIVDGQVCTLDVASIVREAEDSLPAPDFSFRAEHDLRTERIDNDSAKDLPLRLFQATEEGAVVYYKGYALGEAFSADYLRIDGENYLASSVYVALYHADDPQGIFLPLEEAKLLTLLPYEGRACLPIWAFAVVIAVGISAVAAITLLVLRLRKRRSGAKV